MYRVRHQSKDSDEEGHSSDVADDVELEVSHVDLKEALTTRVTGRRKKEEGEEDAGVSKDVASQHDNSAAGIEQAQSVWKATAKKRREHFLWNQRN